MFSIYSVYFLFCWNFTTFIPDCTGSRSWRHQYSQSLHSEPRSDSAYINV